MVRRTPRWKSEGGDTNAFARVVAVIVAACSPSALAVAQAAPPAPETASPATEATAEDSMFDVLEYRVLGSKVLTPLAIQQALYSHLGPRKTIADVEVARTALESAYRAAGYSTVFVDVPEQTVDRGIVRLQVTEGKLDRVRVSGARYFSNRQILSRVPALKAGDVPHFPEVQQQLASLNRVTPDRSVTPVLRAGRFPGTVDVELKVTDDLPFHGSVDFNDRYTADTTELRAGITLGYDNLWQRAHSASLQYQVAPREPDEAAVLAATYIARPEAGRTILALYAVDSSSDVATVGTLSVLGKGNIFGMRAIRPFGPVGKYFHNLTLGLDLKDFDENIRLTEEDGLATAIKYTTWSASYAFGWNAAKSTSELAFGANWGMRGLGNDDAEFEEKRFKARANFGYLTGSLRHTRNVFGEAQFVTRLGWQYANAPLISNEQFSIGGATSVRGYLEAERLGDIGANLSLELHSPSLVKGERVQDWRVFGFVDAGSVSIEQPLPDQISRQRLASAGVGMLFTGFGGLQAELEWARALRDGANVVDGEDRMHFDLKYGF